VRRTNSDPLSRRSKGTLAFAPASAVRGALPAFFFYRLFT
jgi:hypothetical protein